MKSIIPSIVTAAAGALAAILAAPVSVEALPVSIALSNVGNSGNAPDPTVMATDNTSGYGSVGYGYSIGTYDVTLSQYAAFLNAVAKADPYGLYDSSLGRGDQIKGIMQSGASGSYTYSVIGDGQKPVTYVSWLDAARFCNWLQNGQPTGPEGPGTTETGAYTVNGDTSNGIETRNLGAAWWIPSENEWYKAAYYDPTLNAGAGGYWSYPTRSNAAPGNVVGSGTNEANYITANGDFSVTQSSVESGTQNYLTPVGSYTKSASHYGTFDQGGNVYQWNGAKIGYSRGVRGGSWDLASTYLLSNARDSRLPTGLNPGVGFRVASLPVTPVPIEFSLVKGSYDGLGAVGGTNAGLFTVTVTNTGAFTGKLAISGTAYSFAATFSSVGTFSGTVGVVGLALAIDPEAPGVTGTITVPAVDGPANFSVKAGLLGVFNASTIPPGVSGTYTALFQGLSGTSSALPHAPGYGTMTVAATGAVHVSGKLGDGTAFTANGHLHADGMTWTLFDSLYAGNHPGSIAGAMTFESETDSDCDGMIDWIKPPQGSGSRYPGGFNASTSLGAAIYKAPPLKSGTGTFTLSDGGLPAVGITDGLTVSSGSNVIVAGTNGVTVTVTPTTGTFSGSFLFPGTNAATPFSGVIYQKPAPASGYGLFLGTHQSGGVEISQ